MASLGGLLAACQEPPAQSVQGGDRLLVSHRDGLGIFSAGTKKWLAEPKTAATGGANLACVEDGSLVVRDCATARVSTKATLPGLWTPRAASHDQVALLAGSHAAADIYRPEPRVSTSLLVMRDGKERKRFELDGNLEPEAFSSDGERLYLLDYLPPKAPDVYRVRVLNILTGQVDPLSTRTKTVVPTSAEEVMRGRGRHAVYDSRQGILFTLYTHLGDHQHTGELLGVRPGAPNVHAFIHSLHLQDGWAFCIDLPAPFGTGAAEGHTIAMSESGFELYAISAEHGTVAVIDPSTLAITQTRTFSPAAGTAYALGLAEDRLLVGAGRQLKILHGRERDRKDEWALDFDLRGLALGSRLWAGRDGGVSALDLEKRQEIDRAEIPALTALRQAFA
ncbi:hypothetical protein Rhe02_85690 [Rhizocola hellebori]|uniref:Uncharacterized protein n=1 Tax=Rhizocola hellebori TaxID=1392758 RepID=A0A8J3QI76_9ACTN|nr:hypothetical protein Rhe02_85690 [Rhizocola hellebori]